MGGWIDKDGPHFDLRPWDWQRYSEKVRKARYDLDEAALKPYFELNKVLKDGVFYAANKLYGITFKQRHDIPVYQADVMVFEVFDQDVRRHLNGQGCGRPVLGVLGVTQ